MIYIIDYGLGNLNSIANMIKRLGGESIICNDPSAIINAEKIILPGVGAFDHGMRGLQEGGWMDVLNQVVLIKKIPILGICLGMQLMCNGSEEGVLPGLGWIDADVKRFNIGPELKVPHMGWNTINFKSSTALIEKSNEEQRFYFVHSFYVTCNNSDNVLATCHHGQDFVSMFSAANIYGVQFHPEKSHKYGMKLINNFMEL